MCVRFLNLYLFIWLHWVFVAAWAFSLVVESKVFSLVAARGLLIAAVSHVAEHGHYSVRTSVVMTLGLSSCSAWALEHRFSSCGVWA